jgi:hypothetical protein
VVSNRGEAIVAKIDVQPLKGGPLNASAEEQAAYDGKAPMLQQGLKGIFDQLGDYLLTKSNFRYKKIYGGRRQSRMGPSQQLEVSRGSIFLLNHSRNCNYPSHIAWA